MKNEFCEDSIENVRDVLQTVDDGCDHGHYCKFSDHLVDMEEEASDESSGLNPPEENKGHPFHVHWTVVLVDCIYLELLQCIIPF